MYILNEDLRNRLLQLKSYNFQMFCLLSLCCSGASTTVSQTYLIIVISITFVGAVILSLGHLMFENFNCRAKLTVSQINRICIANLKYLIIISNKLYGTYIIMKNSKSPSQEYIYTIIVVVLCFTATVVHLSDLSSFDTDKYVHGWNAQLVAGVSITHKISLPESLTNIISLTIFQI